MASVFVYSMVGVVLCLLIIAVIISIKLKKRRSSEKKTEKLIAKPSKLEPQLIDFSLPIPKKVSYVRQHETNMDDTMDTTDLENFIDPQYYVQDDRRESKARPSLPGSLCFNVKYEASTEKLVVGIIRAERVRSRRTSALTVTPYVKVCLLPDKRKKLQTKARQKTPHPLFNEEFVFHCPISNLRTRCLRFTICDFDRFSRQNVIGNVVFSLDEHYDEVLSEEGCVETWRDIVEDINAECCNPTSAEVMFSLQWLPTAKRIAVLVLEGKGFELDGSGKGLSLHVKIAMIVAGKSLPSRKTSKKTDLNPVFNESFHFDIPDDMMERTSFMLSVFNHKNLIGRVVVGPFLYATGTGFDHWNDMLSAPHSAVSMWHTLF